MSTINNCLVVAMVACLIAADEPIRESPRSAAAVRAIKTHEQQVRWAQAQHQQALRALALECEKELKQALDAALKNKDLMEANRIDLALKDVAAMAVAAAPAAKEFKIDGEWDMVLPAAPFGDSRLTIRGTEIIRVFLNGKPPQKWQTQWRNDVGLIKDGMHTYRFTRAGDRFMVEYWSKGQDADRTPAMFLGIATRR